jgi:hypothetical protein
MELRDVLRVFSILIMTTPLLAFGQKDLYMPLEFQKAYQNGTRSDNGMPGENYWQNSSSYDIKVEIVPGTWEIIGKQRIRYSNNSPDSLNEVVIRMYPNHYKKGGVRANEIPLENLTEGMVISKLDVDGELVAMEESTSHSNLAHAIKAKSDGGKISVERNSTFLVLELVNPIPPDSNTTFSMEWKTEMPFEYVNKIGAYDKRSAFIGYWYPQIAVYDDIDGWDQSEYTGAQECYTDFGDFHVEVTVPEGYFVMATGDLQNSAEVLNDTELTQYRKSRNSTGQVSIFDESSKIGTKDSYKTWVYKASQVRDFGMGVSDNFNWISKSVSLRGSMVSSNIVYDPSDENYLRDLMNIQNEGIHFLSNELPGVAFPYDNFTTFVGVPEFDGMEFPMMANNGFSEREVSNNLMTFHELAHTYLPHWVGINEVKYSWMEEGWVTFLTIKFCQDLYRGTKYENYELERTIKSYNNGSGQQGEVPLFTPSNYMVVRNMHFQQSYRKPAFMYLALENLLGRSLFKKCLKTYLTIWAEKHPTPYDFMFTFNNVSQMDLNWFWEKWVFDYGYADLAIKQNENAELIVENKGGLPVPISLKLTYRDKREALIEKSPKVWSRGNDFISIIVDDVRNLESVQLISNTFPDRDASNNELFF